MDIWIIRDGEKVGPIHDYEVRHKIDSGELTRETPAWHEGLDAWRPLGEIALFKDEFNWVHLDGLDSVPTIEEEEQAILAALPKPPPLPVTPVLGRRFWARWLDIHVYIALWWLCMWASGRNIESVFGNIWIMATQLVPWFIIEAILIHRYGTTPGKWLLGLRVVNVDGTLLGLTAATLRSFRILVGGIGFGLFLLALFCQALSFFTARRLGNPLWDHAGGHRVQSQPLVPWRIATVVCAFLVALHLQVAAIPLSVLKSTADSLPDSFLKDIMKEELQKKPPWHLPER